MVLLCYPKCSTCQSAIKELVAAGVEFESRNIKEEHPSYEELKKWQQESGLPLKKFFNTSGIIYKEMHLKDKLPQMSEEEQLRLLATDGMLVKRPLMVDGTKISIGKKDILNRYVSEKN